jgi:hypothetical protein
MQVSLTQLRKKEYPAGEHPGRTNNVRIVREIRKEIKRKKECWARHQYFNIDESVVNNVHKKKKSQKSPCRFKNNVDMLRLTNAVQCFTSYM